MLGADVVRQIAFEVLDGVGDAAAGEWHDWGAEGVFHLRRRLTWKEARDVGMVKDIRGTDEARERLRDVLHLFPSDWPELQGIKL